MRYAVTVLFDRPIGGVVCRETADTEDGRVYADQGPESAARKWLCRLSAAERAHAVRVLIACPTRDYRVYPVYRGPVVEFERLNGRLEQLVERD